MTTFIRDLILEDTEILTEAAADGKKYQYIHGIFMQAEKKNRNGRIYPKGILEKAVDIFNKDLVSKNRALGELNHPCFKPGANVFVVGKGLVPIEQVVAGDYVYGTSTDNKTTPVLVKESTRTPFDGNLLNFDSRGFKATVTPYHRFYLKNRGGNFDVVTAKEIAEGNNKFRHHYIPLTMENWVGVDEEYINFHATVDRMEGKHNYEYATNPLSMKYKEFCAFMGLYLSEGCIGKYTRKDGTAIGGEVLISQNLGTNFDLMLDLISNIGFNKVSIRTKNDGIKASIVISDCRIADYLMQFGDCYSKFVPEEVLSASKENIQEFLNWFHLGDGALSKSTQKGIEYNQSTVFTVSEKLADGLIECILKSGYSTTKRIQTSAEDYTFADRVIEIENKSPLYRMTIGKSLGKWVDSRFLNITEEYYVGDVFCLVTETENFYVEQHGTCFLTGNCRLNVDPAEACHLITELVWDGSNVLGKARILEGTPKGAILKGLIDGGVCMGVSSRAAGSVKKNRHGINEVQQDLRLATVDAVSDPSAPDAFVQGLMEGVSWIYENGIFLQDQGQRIEEAVNEVKHARSAELEAVKLRLFAEFLCGVK